MLPVKLPSENTEPQKPVQAVNAVVETNDIPWSKISKSPDYCQVDQPVCAIGSENVGDNILAMAQNEEQEADETLPEPAITPEALEEEVEPTPTPLPAADKPQGAPVEQPVPTTPPNPAGGLSPDLIFQMINSKRTAAGLQAFEKEEKLCELATSRTPELAGELERGSLHAGFYGRKLPYWASENVIYMRNEEEAVAWWLNSPVHRASIFGDYKFSCVACLANSCSQIFTNYISK